ncbi:hypothetical protein BV898_10128 [Hypsibius exemplaris]|uniref:Las1-domain-containing protein n=1 Tax=Hypsibius exemplaris TaxID=2072580 RepID=A0A1W0WKN0_HYPEX|nr:hypothetical protein BV898_10128 [Hypsibius exemplaris]
MAKTGPSKSGHITRKRPISLVDQSAIPNSNSHNIGGAPDLLSHLFTRTTLAPWISPEEWTDVYMHLSPVLDNPGNAEILRALDVENIGNIIHSCWGMAWGAKHETADLTIAILKALKAVRDSTDQTTAHMAASMVVIRFVKVVSEPARNSSTDRKTILEICKRVGVPPWVVQMRHDASHAEMHDVEAIQNALIFALTWLKANFWDVEAFRIGHPAYMNKFEKDDSLLPGSDSDREIHSELMGLRRSIKKLDPKLTDKQKRVACLDILTKLDSLMDTHLSAVTTVLTAEFIAPSSVLVESGNKPDAAKPSQWDRQPKLSPRSEAEWGTVVEYILKQPAGTDALLQSFAVLLGDGDSGRDYLVAAWIHRILEQVPKNVVSSVRIWDAVNWTAMCESVTGKPSPYSTGILQKMTAWVNNAKEHRFVQDSLRLAKIMNSLDSKGTSTSHGAARTVDGLFKELNMTAQPMGVTDGTTGSSSTNGTTGTSGNTGTSGTTDGRSWTLANGIAWTGCPIGLLPHQTSANFNLYSSLLLSDVSKHVSPT